MPDNIFEYKRAALEDIDELVRTRIIVLRAANKLSEDEDMSFVEQESYAYYRRALETGEHIAYFVYDNGTFIGAGGVSFYQVMPTFHNPGGKKAYIMNMYTAPEYRRQGIAFHTLDLLVKAVRERGVSQIALEATDMGRPLYEKYGFVKMENEMELK
ncbi:MAG: GNAT family N-acetyltransferase [Lachnospiraceae bacterium]|nr:GNAT family N-acetyltransferase [Lachnospiraceae bacterium]MBO5145733.1 GNAT family N-acetyltransferase [Lachnospiraceae bacterium]MBP3544603.1 GNAT family N-acetyltransferase [Lachnospiraceae bacterium]